MANKQGTNDVVDSFIGDKLIEARYIGQTKYFDAFTDVSGTLPLTYTSRASQVLKNYRLYGTASGAGEQTENVWSDDDARLGYWISAEGALNTHNQFGAVSNEIIVNPGDVVSFAFFGEGHRSHFIAFYDANGFVSREYTTDETSIHTVPSGITRCYLGTATENNISRSTLKSIKSVWQKSSTAPSTYIPYGFKIPLSVNGENLFDETYPGLGSTIKYLPIKVGVGSFTLTTTCPRTDNNAALLFFFAGNVSTGASTQTNGVWSGHSLTVQSSDGYVTIAYRILSSVSPADYSTRLTYDADYTLYIGPSKLGEEEYVDYADGKVYKRTENLFNAEIEQGSVSQSGNFSDTTNRVRTRVTNLEPGQTYTVTSSLYVRAAYEFINGFESTNKVGILVNNASGVKSPTFTMTTGNCVAIGFMNSSGTDITPSDISEVMLVEGSTAPAQYIPYLQPTDPPVPLPEITAYNGENTLSSTETVGDVTVKGRIGPVV